MRPTFTFQIPGAKDVWTYEQLDNLPEKKRPQKVEVVYVQNESNRRSLGMMPTYMALLKFG
jgi:hypothetical protein